MMPATAEKGLCVAVSGCVSACVVHLHRTVARAHTHLRPFMCLTGCAFGYLWLSAMIPRVYEKEEFVETARRITVGANASVTRRWKLPVFGKLTCSYVGAAQDVVTHKTQVSFKWEFASQHVKSEITKTMPASDAQEKTAKRLLVPYPMKLAITCAYIWKRLALTAALPVMQKCEDVKILAITASKLVDTQFQTTVAKRRHGVLVEAPILEHVDGDKYVVCLPSSKNNPNRIRTWLSSGLKVVSVEKKGAEKKAGKRKRSRSDAQEEEEDSAIPEGTVKANLPQDLVQYNRIPFKNLRDMKAVAVWKAEEVRATDGEFDFKKALAGMEADPLKWFLYDDRTMFVAWSSKAKKKTKYHLTLTSIKTILRVLATAGK